MPVVLEFIVNGSTYLWNSDYVPRDGDSLVDGYVASPENVPRVRMRIRELLLLNNWTEENLRKLDTLQSLLQSKY